MKKLISILIVTSILCLTGCNNSSSKVVSLDIPEDSIQLCVGEDYSIDVNIEPSDSIDNVNYMSSDSSIAEVSDNGVIYAVSIGECSISLSIDGLEKNINVSVSRNYSGRWTLWGFNRDYSGAIFSLNEDGSGNITYINEDIDQFNWQLLDDDLLIETGSGESISFSTQNSSDSASPILVGEDGLYLIQNDDCYEENIELLKSQYLSDAVTLTLEGYHDEFEDKDGIFYYGGGNGFAAFYNSYIVSTLEVEGVFPDDGVLCCTGTYYVSSRTYTFNVTIRALLPDELSHLNVGDNVTICYQPASKTIDSWSVLYTSDILGSGFIVSN